MRSHHRTGEPLVLTDAAGNRGWVMRQDADGVWRAENKALHPDGMPKKGTPNSYGYDANGDLRKYAENRPNHKPEDIKTVWDTTHTDINNLIEDGVLRDLPKLDRPDQTWLRAPEGAQPNGKDIRETLNTDTGKTEVYQLETWKPGDKQNWDMGHVRGEEYRRIHDLYMRGPENGGISEKEFLKRFTDLDNYNASNAPRNRSHVDEDKTPLPPR
ncbi:hypothetical protein TPB0596_44670 [Tsukamurella pulmonis]|uniref:GH-E family nuclease n=1 Tax=Tsukamurella pulmonis TaxID=47312 RepID=UPI001EE08361|nr:GH-E family nuclease [Tsukamurella pulmonis]BDD84704.1 hypothetical protein TPB0596_44670 [Tsukamurella pulmonis]